jgi:hypothetical protein
MKKIFAWIVGWDLGLDDAPGRQRLITKMPAPINLDDPMTTRSGRVRLRLKTR